jgi:RHH-type proline utilization regulon transcriptional repressor/proline dehydrogenase/delta 1-pyrroline-5-carboxylate dehydrogenase
MALDQPGVRQSLAADMEAELEGIFAVTPLVDGKPVTGTDAVELVLSPHDRRHRVGTSHRGSGTSKPAMRPRGRPRTLGQVGGPARADILRGRRPYERNRVRLMAAMVREAGKTVGECAGDVREAIDFLRYYALEARRLFAGPSHSRAQPADQPARAARPRSVRLHIPGTSRWRSSRPGRGAGRGPGAAKPAEQTPITAFLAVRLLHEAGVPPAVLNLLPGGGAVGAALVKDPRVAGVVFTGSNATGWAIQGALADRRGAMVPFIAETGGLNAMIADSSALPGAGDPRPGALRLRFGGPALLGRAAVLRAGRGGQADDRHAGRRRGGARHRRPARLRDRHRPRHRRRCGGPARRS